MTIRPLGLKTIVNNCLVLMLIENLHENDDYLQQIGIDHFFLSKLRPNPIMQKQVSCNEYK